MLKFILSFISIMGGRVESNKAEHIKTLRKCVDKEEINLNGKTQNHKNGYSNGALQSNGTGKMYKENEFKPPPPMDWSQYDTFPGSFEKCSLMSLVLTHIGLYILMFLGFLNKMLFTPKVHKEKNREGYAPLYNPFEQFYSRYVYRRVSHCFNRPICSAPANILSLMERESTDFNWSFKLTGKVLRCINLGSYNYLGLSGEREPVAEAVRKYGLTLSSPRAELGECRLHLDLEKETADFLGVESAIVFGMGFATNTLSLPGLLSPDCLAISDENNHASIILGLRLSRVTVRVFRHNDVRHLEKIARQAIAENKWKKIVILVEGVYSMEGSIAPLQAIVALKKQLGLQLFVDEAHSIGALGPRGRGVTDYWGVPPSDVDILMGTFTKSFGAAGGYIAGPARLVNHIRAAGHAAAYAHSMAPPVAAQVLAAMRRIRSPAGQLRVRALRDNTRYFRERLRSMGVVVFGHPDSPVVPLLVYTFSKMAATVERLTERGLAVVGVGFPATPLSKARIRFCLSAAHTRPQLDECLRAIADVVAELGLRYSRQPPH
ncbi:serine palmitoyltransferase 3 [Plodia interpunctella]|uniref:serine palmitoyltransferase 3 n=1 Tax=Plodia interpunctella TaxID=58824 RepID=UPI002368BFE8|nr:serine palmitoyltransferase 3 [Plodia interpunctella]